MKNKNEIENYYENFSSVLKHDLIYRNRRHLKHMIILNHIFKGRKIRDVLEIGTGVGVITNFLSRKAKNIISIDISSNNLKIAKKYLKKNVNLIHGNILDAEINEKFDLIVLLDTMEHIPKQNLSKLFKKIKNMMRPNTLILITIPNPDFLGFISKEGKRLQIVDEQIYPKEIFNLCIQNKLTVISFKLFGINYMYQYATYQIERNNNRFKKLDRSETLNERLLNKFYNNRFAIFIRKLIWKYRFNGKF